MFFMKLLNQNSLSFPNNRKAAGITPIPTAKCTEG